MAINDMRDHTREGKDGEPPSVPRSMIRAFDGFWDLTTSEREDRKVAHLHFTYDADWGFGIHNGASELQAPMNRVQLMCLILLAERELDEVTLNMIGEMAAGRTGHYHD
jgi:hypothetical protein